MLALHNYAGFVWFESPETTKNVIDFYLFLCRVGDEKSIAFFHTDDN